MASLTRPPPPLLRPNNEVGNGNGPGNVNKPSQLSPLGFNQNPNPNPNQSHAITRDGSKTHNRNYSGPGATPMNTPAFNPPIAPRLGGGRPIGRGSSFGAGAAHAATPGNTPSSLETMGKRIAGRLQGINGANGAGAGDGKETGASAITGGARIAPSYERRFTAGLHDVTHRLTTHKENAVDSPPENVMQQLQLASPSGTAESKKQDWPITFDTSTTDNSPADQKPERKNQFFECQS